MEKPMSLLITSTSFDAHATTLGSPKDFWNFGLSVCDDETMISHNSFLPAVPQRSLSVITPSFTFVIEIQ